MRYVFTSSGARELDADLARLDLLELTMEHAGARVARELAVRFPRARVLILAGSGANGGDALVAARHLHAAGRPVRVLAQDARHPLTRAMWARLVAMLPVEPLDSTALPAALADADVVLDGLLGTGFEPPLRGHLPDVVRAVNAAGKPIASVDVPSGLRADVVEHDEPVVQADVTFTLIGFKPALLFHDVGPVEVLDLGVPPALLPRHARAALIADDELRALLPRRARGAHKGSAGRVHVIGGAPGYGGAPSMTALAALRAGAGLVSLYSTSALPHHPVEAMAHQLNDWAELADVPRPDAAAVGMGLRHDAVSVAREVLSWGVSCVMDADALQPELRGLGHDVVVWTPHPGEAARMLGVSVPEVTRDPLASAEALQRTFGGVVVLKGGPSVIATRAGLWICPRGNPGMATGGSGDVLSGVIAALLAQGLSADDAAVAGVDWHARAGDHARDRLGYGLIATDIAHALGPVWRNLTDGASEIL